MTAATSSHSPKSTGRPRVLAVSLCAHGLVLLALARTPSAMPARMGDGTMAVSLVAGQALVLSKAPPAAKPPTKRPRHAKEPPPFDPSVPPRFVDADWSPQDFVLDRDPSEDPIAISVSAAATEAGARACQLTTWLQGALQADADVQASLRTIPRPARSVANALMIWDGGWVTPRAEAAQGYANLRSALIRGVQAAPADCQDQLVRGPEFMTLVDGQQSVFLAIGSGEWRWADLLRPSFQFTPAIAAARDHSTVKGSYLAKMRQIFAPLVIH